MSAKNTIRKVFIKPDGTRITPTISKEFCTVEDFINKLINTRKKMKELSVGLYPIYPSDENLANLIRTVYKVSSCPEEGRYPKFRLFIYDKEKGVRLNYISFLFKERIKLTAENLRRLAPIVSGFDHALLIEEDGPEMYCVGQVPIDLVNDRNLYDYFNPDRIYHGGILPSRTMIRVEGPGEIRVSWCGFVSELKGCQINSLNSFSDINRVEYWYKTIASIIYQDVNRMFIYDDQQKKHRAMNSLHLMVRTVWENIISKTIEGGHGGAYVVLPSDGYDSTMINIGFPANGVVDLKEQITNFWGSYEEMEYAEKIDNSQLRLVEFKKNANKYFKNRDLLFDKANSLLNLSNVDGCVVLNNRLDLLGFGGIIKCIEKSEGETYIESDPITLEYDSNSDCKSIRLLGGTRHRSIYSLCKKIPSTLAFVISQDKQLKVFYGDNGNVHVWISAGASTNNDW